MTMKQILILLVAAFVFAAPRTGYAQGEAKAAHRIVFHITSNDSMSHKMLMRNVHYALEAVPDASIQVVCNGPGLDVLMADRSVVEEKIAGFTARGVVFDACLNTMKERKIEKEQIIKEATFIPSAVVHLMELQEGGWSYIKGGF